MLTDKQDQDMPRGPKGEKGPAHVIGSAVNVMRIATGEEPGGLQPDAGIRGQEPGRRGARANGREGAGSDPD